MTVIQIKRSTGVAAPTTGDLAEGELAYSEDRSANGAGAVLYIESVASDGTTAVIDKIGGKYYTNTVDELLTPATSSVGGAVEFFEGTSNGSNKIVMKAPNSITSDLTYTLPVSPTNGYYLQTDGSGNLSWASVVSSITIADNQGTPNTDTFNTGETLTFAGTANQIVTTVSNNQVAFALATDVSITGDVTVGGNDIKMSGGTTALTFSGSGDVAVAGDLTVTGNDIKSSSATALTLSGADVEVKGDLQVTGNDIKNSNGSAQITFAGTSNNDIRLGWGASAGALDIYSGEIRSQGTTFIQATGQNVQITGDLTVSGNDIKMSGGTTAITFSGSGDVAIAGDLQVGGNDIKTANGATALTLTDSTGDVAVKGDLKVEGNDIKSSTGATALTLDGANVTVAGNLTVNGSSTIVNSTTVTIDDVILKLADGNTGNSVDSGVYGEYVESATTKYSGYFRDASDSNIFKFFVGLEAEPSTTVNTSGTGYTVGTIYANLTGGSITNLASALTVPNGGTGAATFTTNGVLYGNGTGAIQATAAGTDTYILKSASGVPTWSNVIDGGTY
jgi:hypothetical protein